MAVQARLKHDRFVVISGRAVVGDTPTACCSCGCCDDCGVKKGQTLTGFDMRIHTFTDGSNPLPSADCVLHDPDCTTRMETSELFVPIGRHHIYYRGYNPPDPPFEDNPNLNNLGDPAPCASQLTVVHRCEPPNNAVVTEIGAWAEITCTPDGSGGMNVIHKACVGVASNPVTSGVCTSETLKECVVSGDFDTLTSGPLNIDYGNPTTLTCYGGYIDSTPVIA